VEPAAAVEPAGDASAEQAPGETPDGEAKG
jgi:hypothetical protein